MISQLFGRPIVELVPEKLRTGSENELYEFAYAVCTALAQMAEIGEQPWTEALKTFIRLDSTVKLAKASIESIEHEWPAGESAVSHLSDVANIMPIGYKTSGLGRR